VFCDTLTNIKIDVMWPKSVLVKTTGQRKLRITVMLLFLDFGRKLKPFVILLQILLSWNYI
jgi:hypothetical protein